MMDSPSNDAHRLTHHSTIHPSWPNPCRINLRETTWLHETRWTSDDFATSTWPVPLITNHYEMNSTHMLYAATPLVTTNWTSHLAPANVPHSRIMQPQYQLKVDQIQPSTSQDAPPPFATTTSACIPTLFIVNAFSICVHVYCNHWPSFMSTVNINRLEVYIKIIYLIWRCISHLLTSKHEI